MHFIAEDITLHQLAIAVTDFLHFDADGVGRGVFVIRAKAGKTAEELAFWLVGQVGRRPATGMPARPPGNVDSRDPIPSGSFRSKF